LLTAANRFFSSPYIAKNGVNRVFGSTPFFFAVEPCCGKYRLLQATVPFKTPEFLLKFHLRLSIIAKLLYTKQERNIDNMKTANEYGYVGI
jgi:hypothetical protein